MSFAAPGILLGLLLLGLPLWLHRLRTDAARSEPFSSVRLLEAASQRVFVDKRLRYWLLLALRLALLALAVLVFARPQLSAQAGVSDANLRHWVLLDMSASMGRPDLEENLRAAVQAAVEGVPADQPVGLLSIDQELAVVEPLSQNRAALVAAVSTVQAGNSRHDVADMLESVGDFLDRDAAGSVVHLVSDFQASAMPAQFSRVVPRSPFQLILHPVGGSLVNTRVEAAQMDGDRLTLSLKDAQPGQAITIKVGDQPPMSPRLAADSQVLQLPLQLLPQQNLISISFSDDGLASDNSYALLVDRSPADQVPALTARPGPANPFLSSALAAVSQSAALQPEFVEDFDPRALSRHRWLVIEDLGSLPDQLARSLSAWVSAGGRVLAGVGSRAEGLSLLPLTQHSLVSADAEQDLLTGMPAVRLVSGVALGHPLLDPRLAYDQIQVSRIWPLQAQSGDQPLLWLADGTPLVLEHALGEGRVLLVNGGFDRSFNNWPTQSSFVPFVGLAADYLAGYKAFASQWLAGSVLTLPPDEAVTYELIPPGAADSLFGSALGVAGARLSATGFYTLHGSDNSTRYLAVNVDPRESDLRAADPATMERWRQALNRRALAPGADSNGLPAPVEASDNRLIIWLLAALLAIALAESALANTAMRKPA